MQCQGATVSSGSKSCLAKPDTNPATCCCYEYQKVTESNIESLFRIADQKQHSGEVEEAASIYRKVLELQPDCVPALYNLGNVLQDQGQLEAAVTCYQQALNLKPDFAQAYNNLGNTLQQQGKLDEAVEAHRHALKLQPELPLFHNNLGNALQQQGKLVEAVRAYRQTLELQPDFVTAHNNLGNIFKQQGRVEAAVACYQRALSLQPDYALAHNNLGSVQQQQGQFGAAVKAYQEAIRLRPDFARAHYNLGTSLRQQGKLDAAIGRYRQACRLEPDYLPAHLNLGGALHQQGKVDEAAKSFQSALRIQPDSACAQFGRCIGQLPFIYSSVDEIELRRRRYRRYLEDLAEHYRGASPRIVEKAADAVGSLQPFYLAYQGLNDRSLQKTYGEMIWHLMSSRYRQWSEPIPPPATVPGDKVRVGVVSGFFCDHANWSIPIRGWVQHLDRSQFELFGYYTQTRQDKVTAIAARSFGRFVQGPLPFEKWGELIARDKLHVLIFPEFGMDPIALMLGCLRLAPLQMTSWGHPDTSGLPTIDNYLSSDLMEPNNAQENYTETLVRLPNLSINYEPLKVRPHVIIRCELELASDELMFWCCQSLFKYLPQHDDVFPRIAKEVGRCKFVFIQHPTPLVTEKLCERLHRAFQELGLDFVDHCKFLPILDLETFAGVSARADVFLDSIGWSGCNSSLEAIAANIPIVTLPGDLMRARHTTAILKMMGVDELVASSKDDYVTKVVGLAQDPELRQHLSRKIAENRGKVYGDLEPVRALEDFIVQWLEDHRVV